MSKGEDLFVKGMIWIIGIMFAVGVIVQIADADFSFDFGGGDNDRPSRGPVIGRTADGEPVYGNEDERESCFLPPPDC